MEKVPFPFSGIGTGSATQVARRHKSTAVQTADAGDSTRSSRSSNTSEDSSGRTVHSSLTLLGTYPRTETESRRLITSFRRDLAAELRINPRRLRVTSISLAAPELPA